ncbi:MAG: ABC transporter ATP-binding protein [bacterium]|nr:ABC transporter ATP-binding protein [bacterium]MCY3652468.1 ABC transporter ATP-binding protein [bacterium]
MTPIISVENLTKHYGDFAALSGISFTVEEGEVLAILGPNGAGKTTTVEILEGYRRAGGGSISVLGHDPASGGRALRDRIGIVLQETGIEVMVTVKEAIETYGRAYSKRLPTDELISLVGLEGKADARIRTLSGGQNRRLDLALGLVGDPDVLFLDEPTTGFDPSARRRSWAMIEGLTKLGKTILLTTHYLDEAQHLADRIIVLSGGLIVAEGTAASLGEGRSFHTISFMTDRPDELPKLEARPEMTGRTVTYRSTSVTEDLFVLTGWARERGVELTGLEVTRPSLEEIYLDIIGEAEAVAVAGIGQS